MKKNIVTTSQDINHGVLDVVSVAPFSSVASSLPTERGTPTMMLLSLEPTWLSPLSIAISLLKSGASVMVSPSGQYPYDPNGHIDSLKDGEEGMDTFTRM